MPNQEEISYDAFKKKRPSWTKTTRRNIEYYALLGGVKLGNQLSFEKLQWCGRCLGRIAYHLLKKDRGIVEQQLAIVFPTVSVAQRNQWAYDCFLHFGQMLFEVLGMEHVIAEVDQRIAVYGEEFLKEGQERGKGTIVLGAHLGNWEMLTPYFMKTGLSAKVAVKPLYDERLNKFFIELRERGGVQLIQRGMPKAARAILDCFKQNQLFFVLIDQDTDVSSMFVPFFGRPAQTPVVASNLALKTGALVLSGMAIRKPQGRFEIHLERVGVFEKKKYDKYDVLKLTAQFNDHIEQIIRRDPSQWAWFHRRWKHKPTEKDLQLLQEFEEVRERN
ncbi:MAG: lysophospholipid acyltransferase family protein [SAR324 cluster bacterium]|nr:lysophospholipid acyltransferase family protein [SAR324 cluster bacterium]